MRLRSWIRPGGRPEASAGQPASFWRVGSYDDEVTAPAHQNASALCWAVDSWARAHPKRGWSVYTVLFEDAKTITSDGQRWTVRRTVSVTSTGFRGWISIGSVGVLPAAMTRELNRGVVPNRLEARLQHVGYRERWKISGRRGRWSLALDVSQLSTAREVLGVMERAVSPRPGLPAISRPGQPLATQEARARRLLELWRSIPGFTHGFAAIGFQRRTMGTADGIRWGIVRSLLAYGDRELDADVQVFSELPDRQRRGAQVREMGEKMQRSLLGLGFAAEWVERHGLVHASKAVEIADLTRVRDLMDTIQLSALLRPTL